ncbi:alanine--tRNA ligase [Patescibacteria group bacterium]
MTAKELKDKYLKFFKDKGHEVIPSASLIPENDPTTLFISAGMHPLVPYLLGENHPSGKRLVDFQKCIRTGDIDEVGDDVHLTFFEMLGNWSLGDYWKEESLSWSFEFLTKELGIPTEKLSVSCFEGDKDAPKDEESVNIWKKLGISEDRIIFFGKEHNWWGPAGETGPCGPDSEIFYWVGEGDPPPLTTGDNSEGWVEIWNNVFMEYNKTIDGKYIPLSQRNVDTGMGVERTVTVLNGKDNVFDTKIFQPLIEKIKELASKEDKKAERIIADHIRAATFILGDQKAVAPSNVGQGYVLRKLIRRVIRFGKILGINDPFLVELSSVVIDQMSDDYPELLDNKDFIEKYLRLEEEKFGKTLEKGLEEFEKIATKDISGKDAFLLFSSFGFPLEMTEELAKEKGINVDTVGFEEEFSKHQEVSKAGSDQKFKGGLADHSEAVTAYHTTTHLLQMALQKVLGDHVHQVGSNITSERLRFDFTHESKLNEEEVKGVEKIINGAVDQKIPVQFEVLPLEKAKEIGCGYLEGEKYPDKVKVYFIGDSLESAISKEFCGGPHVTNTSELKHIEIFKQKGMGEGKSRIYAHFV